MPKPDRTIHINTDINAYEGYMPDDWGEKVIGPTPKGTILERLLLDLGLAWRSASYTAQMPATAIKVMHAATLGEANFASPKASITHFAEGAIGRLANRVPELVANRTLGNRLVKELKFIATDFRDKARKIKHDFPIAVIWDQFMNDVAFQISLWSSQRIAFVAFYNAYEAFIVDTLKVGLAVTSLRVTNKKEFNAALRSALGSDITAPCWSHDDINVARLIRHALSHNGGRETADLKKTKHGVKLIGEDLQIVPEDNHRMLRHLREAVEHIAAVVKGNPKFQAAAAKLPQPQEDDD